MTPENNRLSLNATKPRNDGNDSPIEEPRKVWIKRWLAHLADFFIVVILSFIVYSIIGMPIVESTAAHQDTVNLYNRLTDDKIDFLIEQNILIKSSNEKEKYKSDNESLEIFVRAYIDPKKNGPGPNDKGDYNGYSDPIKGYYFTNNLKAYNEETAKEKNIEYRAEYKPSLDPIHWCPYCQEGKYTEERLIKYFNDNSHKIFKKVDDDKAQIIDGKSSPKELLGDYLGINDNGLVDKYDSNNSLWRYMLRKFNSLRLQATKEALSSLEEMPTEIALVETYAKINKARVDVLLISWVVAYLLTFGLPILFFKNGRTIGKRVLGFYVISKDDTKASILQHIGRILLIFPQTLFGIIFPMFLIFGANLFAVPILGTMTLLIPATISFVLLLCSDALSFASKGDMSNFQDWLTYSKVIYLKDGHGLDEALHEKKKAEKNTTALDIEDNIFGKKNE